MRKLSKLLAPFKRGLQQMVRAAEVIKVDDSGPIQMIQIETLSGEIITVPRVQNFGHSSVPPKGAKGVVAAVGGNTNSYALVSVDDGNHRVKGLKEGESIEYDAFGQYTYYKANGEIEQKANNKVVVTVPKYILYGDAYIEGNLRVSGDIIDNYHTNTISISGIRQIYNDHDHNETNSVTNQPNQQMVGVANP